MRFLPEGRSIDSCLRLFMLSFIVFLVTLGCKKLELSSDWKDREITIDGDHTDWVNALSYVEDKEVSIGLMNDEEYLYVCLVPGNRPMQSQIVRLGFTVWLDGEGGNKKNFGIRYPLGMMKSGVSVRELGFGGRKPEGELDVGRFGELMEQSLSELEIVGPEKNDVRRMNIEQVEGIDIEVGNTTGRFVYELKVPLVQGENHPYAVGVEGMSTIGIGFETAEIDRDEMRAGMQERMGGMRGGGRSGGGRTGGGRMGGGMRGGARPEMPKPLKVWTTVHLAADTSSVSF